MRSSLHSISSVCVRNGYMLLLCLLVVAPHGVRAQLASSKPGTLVTSHKAVIDSALLHAIQTAPKAEQWPEHDYALLLDVADVTVKSDGTVITRYRQTYKLFTARARSLAEVNLPYNASYQKINVLNARTIQEDGNVVSLPTSAIRPAAQFSEDLLYDDAKGVGFSLPAIKNNSVIDYSWEEVSRPLFMPGQFWFSWDFAGQTPVECSRLTLHYPTTIPLHVALHNTNGNTPTVTTSVQGNVTTTVWEGNHMKPLPKEPLMPEWDDVTPRLEISSLNSWQEVARWYWKLQQPQTSSSPALKAMALQLTEGKETPEERARAIYEWVSRSVRYVGLEFGVSAFKPHRAIDVQANLYGDCKDKATLLIAMLAEVGIKAYPTLLHTETHHFLERNLPTPDAFDHCIACADVNGKEVWLDATSENCAYGDIPDADRGVQVLVVRDGVGEQKTIPDFTSAETGQDTLVKVDLHPDGSARFTADLTWRGRSRQEMEDLLDSRSPSRQERLMKSFASQISAGATLEKAVCSRSDSAGSDLILHLECSTPHWAKRVGDLLILPAACSFSIPSTQTLTEEKRIWPIVQESGSALRAQVVITLPVSTIVEGMPEEIKSMGPLQNFERHFQRASNGSTLTITQGYLAIPGTIPAEKYADYKAYNSLLEGWADDQIVLHVGH